jgi:predicted Zn-dependent protease
LISQSFSQEYEKEADDVGWDYLVKANIDPRGMIEMFQKLKFVEAQQSSTMMPKAFDSHPDIDKRIARLKAKWKKLPRKAGFVELQSDPQ